MIERAREVELVEEEDVEKVRSLEAAGCAARVQALDNGDSPSSALQVLLVLSFESLGLLRATFNLNIQNVLERHKSSKHTGKKCEVKYETTQYLWPNIEIRVSASAFSTPSTESKVTNA